MAAAVAPEYCKPDVRVNPQVVPVGDHAPLFTCRIATQASTITLVHNVERNRVATVDVGFKFGVNRHSGSRNG